MKRFLQRLYYVLESLLARNPLYQIMLISVLILALSLLGGLIAYYFEPEGFQTVGSAVWWAFLRLSDPGYLGDDQGFILRSISVTLTISGYVFFLGALVAFMTNWLHKFFDFLSSGRSPIFEKDHILIIGWNKQLHSLLEEIVNTSLKAEKKPPAVAILCENYYVGMSRELMQKIDPKLRRWCRLLVRSGNPLELESLERVDYSRAASIILLNTPKVDRDARLLSDIGLAKIVMSLKAHHTLESAPNVVAEVAFSGNKRLVESAWWKTTEALVLDQIMGRILYQCLRVPALTHVHESLLMDTSRNSIVLRSCESLEWSGRKLREVVFSLPLSICFGTLRGAEGQESLSLLALDQELCADDMLIFITSSEEEHYQRRLPRQCHSTGCHKQLRSLLVVGWSTDLITLLAELGNHSGEIQITILLEVDHPQKRSRLESVADKCENLKLNFSFGKILERSDLIQANIEKYDRILLLADQTQDPLVADAENILRHVLLTAFIEEHGLHLDLVVEVNDEDNYSLYRGESTGLILSSEIASHLLAKVAYHPGYMWIYEELFTRRGIEFELRPIEKSDWTYSAHHNRFLEEQVLLVGFLRNGEVSLNPPHKTAMLDDDLLIVLTKSAVGNP